MCKTLQNNKALVSTSLPDGMYYEITNNGDVHEIYMDVYKKWNNIVYKEEQPQEPAKPSKEDSKEDTVVDDEDLIL